MDYKMMDMVAKKRLQDRELETAQELKNTLGAQFTESEAKAFANRKKPAQDLKKTLGAQFTQSEAENFYKQRK